MPEFTTIFSNFLHIVSKQAVIAVVTFVKDIIFWE